MKIEELQLLEEGKKKKKKKKRKSKTPAWKRRVIAVGKRPGRPLGGYGPGPMGRSGGCDGGGGDGGGGGGGGD